MQVNREFRKRLQNLTLDEANLLLNELNSLVDCLESEKQSCLREAMNAYELHNETVPLKTARGLQIAAEITRDRVESLEAFIFETEEKKDEQSKM